MVRGEEWGRGEVRGEGGRAWGDGEGGRRGGARRRGEVEGSWVEG